MTIMGMQVAAESGVVVCLIRNLRTGEMSVYPTLRTATDAALEENAADPDHPAFHLFVGDLGGRMAYKGRLWRNFGAEFNRENPWNPAIL